MEKEEKFLKAQCIKGPGLSWWGGCGGHGLLPPWEAREQRDGLIPLDFHLPSSAAHV